MSQLFVCILIEGTTSSRVLFSGFVLLKIWQKKFQNLAKLVKEKQKFPLFCQKSDQICGEKNSDRLQVPTQYQCGLQFYHLWVGNIKSPVGLNKKKPFDLLSLRGQSKPAPSRTQLLMVCEHETRFHGIPVPHWLPM
jgi:hypothetical protein